MASRSLRPRSLTRTFRRRRQTLFGLVRRKNPPRIGLDEVRFTHAALAPRRFLNVTPELVLIAESFEKPEITGYKQNSAPPGWIGSAVGFGCDKRGLIDEGDGAEFTTPRWTAGVHADLHQ